MEEKRVSVYASIGAYNIMLYYSFSFQHFIYRNRFVWLKTESISEKKIKIIGNEGKLKNKKKIKSR